MPAKINKLNNELSTAVSFNSHSIILEKALDLEDIVADAVPSVLNCRRIHFDNHIQILSKSARISDSHIRQIAVINCHCASARHTCKCVWNGGCAFDVQSHRHLYVRFERSVLSICSPFAQQCGLRKWESYHQDTQSMTIFGEFFQCIFLVFL